MLSILLSIVNVCVLGIIAFCLIRSSNKGLRKSKKKREALDLKDRWYIENTMYYYRRANNNQEREKLVMEMLEKIGHIVNKRLVEGIGR